MSRVLRTAFIISYLSYIKKSKSKYCRGHFFNSLKILIFFLCSFEVKQDQNCFDLHITPMVPDKVKDRENRNTFRKFSNEKKFQRMRYSHASLNILSKRKIFIFTMDKHFWSLISKQNTNCEFQTFHNFILQLNLLSYFILVLARPG